MGAKEALVVTAAPSGPDVETTSTEFVDIPGLTATIATAADGNLAITVTGEVETSSDRRMFVRALVDDAPVTPDDVVFAVGEFTGARSFTFVKKDPRAGFTPSARNGLWTKAGRPSSETVR